MRGERRDFKFQEEMKRRRRGDTHTISSPSSFPFLSMIPPHVRLQVLEFLIHSSLQLRLPPIVKYTALSLFAERFFQSLHRKTGFLWRGSDVENWLLQPLSESNLQLFALISIWISSKIHDTCPLSVKSLKSLGDVIITDQHFTMQDFVEAELVFMTVLKFEIGVSNIAFIFLEELLLQLRELSRVGELVKFHVCMDIMDLLYETEETSMLFNSPRSLAASILVASYVITVPKQRWEFPLLPWVKFVTSYKEEEIGELVRVILKHVLKGQSQTKGSEKMAREGHEYDVDWRFFNSQ